MSLTTNEVSLYPVTTSRVDTFVGTLTSGHEAESLIANSLVDIDPDYAVSATNIPNRGTGGSGYSLTVGVGTTANLSLTSALGHQVLSSSGGAGLETAAGQSIANPVTVFAVARFNNASPSANQNIFGARSLSSAVMSVFSKDASSDDFSFFQGSADIELNGSYDTSPHVFTAQFNGGSTSKLTVSGVGSVTDDGGPDDWDFGSILVAASGGSSMQGYIARLLVFDYALSETQVSAIQSYLSAYYGGI